MWLTLLWWIITKDVQYLVQNWQLMPLLDITVCSCNWASCTFSCHMFPPNESRSLDILDRYDYYGLYNSTSCLVVNHRPRLMTKLMTLGSNSTAPTSCIHPACQRYRTTLAVWKYNSDTHLGLPAHFLMCNVRFLESSCHIMRNISLLAMVNICIVPCARRDTIISEGSLKQFFIPLLWFIWMTFTLCYISIKVLFWYSCQFQLEQMTASS